MSVRVLFLKQNVFLKVSGNSFPKRFCMKLSIQRLQCFHPKLGGECSVVMSALYSGLRSCSPSCFASKEKTWMIKIYKLNAYQSTSVIHFIRSHHTTSIHTTYIHRVHTTYRMSDHVYTFSKLSSGETNSGFEIRNKSKGCSGPLPLKLWGSSLILKGPKTARQQK